MLSETQAHIGAGIFPPPFFVQMEIAQMEIKFADLTLNSDPGEN